MFCFCFVVLFLCVCAVYAPALDNGVLDVLLFSFHGGFGGMGNVSFFFFLVLLSFVGKFDVVFFLSWVIALFWPLLAFWLFSPLTCLFICFLACFVKIKIYDMIWYDSTFWFHYFINSANTIKMYMTSRAAQFCLVCRMRPIRDIFFPYPFLDLDFFYLF